MADLAGFFGALEHFPNRAAFDDLDGRVMQLIEIDVIGLQAAQAFVHHATDIIRLENALALDSVRP